MYSTYVTQCTATLIGLVQARTNMVMPAQSPAAELNVHDLNESK